MSPSEQGFFTVVDLKRYAYCPRIIFITSVLHLEERESEAMEMGAEKHDASFITPLLVKLRASRVLRGLELESVKLCLAGKLDYLVVTENQELVPIEVKWSDSIGGKAKWDHRVQLAAYALLIEEVLGFTVKRGYVYYLRDRRLAEVLLDEGIRRIVKRILKSMHEMVLEERDPGVKAPLSRCINCGYRPYCRPGVGGSAGHAHLTNSYIKVESPYKGPESLFPKKVAENNRFRQKSKKT